MCLGERTSYIMEWNRRDRVKQHEISDHHGFLHDTTVKMDEGHKITST